MLKQQFLPGFPDGAVRIGDMLSILTKDGRVTYFIGSDSYFDHALDDKQSERFVLTSLMHHGHVRACHLKAKPLAMPHRTLMKEWPRQWGLPRAVRPGLRPPAMCRWPAF